VLEFAGRVRYYVPAEPLFPEDVAPEPENKFPYAHLETESALPLVVVVNGDCDLERSAATEPFVLVCPLVPDANPGQPPGSSTRFFPFPIDKEYGPVRLDARFAIPIERPVALAAPKRPCPLDEVTRGKLPRLVGRSI